MTRGPTGFCVFYFRLQCHVSVRALGAIQQARTRKRHIYNLVDFDNLVDGLNFETPFPHPRRHHGPHPLSLYHCVFLLLSIYLSLSLLPVVCCLLYPTRTQIMAYVLSDPAYRQHLETTGTHRDAEREGSEDGEGTKAPNLPPEELVEVLCGDLVMEPHLYVGERRGMAWGVEEGYTSCADGVCNLYLIVKAAWSSV